MSTTRVPSQLVESISTHYLQIGKLSRRWQVCQEHAGITGIAGKVDQVGIMSFSIVQELGKVRLANRIFLFNDNLVAICCELRTESICQALGIQVGRIIEERHVPGM